MSARTLTFAAILGLAAATAQAATHEVMMLNKGEAGMMVFEPAFLAVEPGDTVVFKPTDKGHNAESIDGMVPDGADPIKGKMNSEVSVTFDTEGVYGFKCKPHYAMGMVAMIQVGEAGNLDDAKAAKNPKKAVERFEPLFANITQ